MILPKTLSRDVIAAIDKGPILVNLGKTPLLLAKFFFQAIQSPAWCKQSWKLLCKTAAALYYRNCIEILPWSAIHKSMEVVCRYFSTSLLLPMPDSEDPEIVLSAHNYIKFLMSRNCSLFRKRNMFSHNKSEIKPLFEHINMDDFRELYSRFITDDFSKFYSLPLIYVKNYLMQCDAWGFYKGVNALQRIYAHKINDCRTAIMAISFADLYKFNIIKARAFEVIESLEFCEGTYSGHTFYSQLTFGSSFDVENMKLSLEERRNNDEAIFIHNRSQNMAIQSIGFQDTGCQEPGFIVGFKMIEIESELKETRKIYHDSKKIHIPRNKIKRLTLDHSCCTNLEFLLGTLIYFNEVLELEISNFVIPLDLFKHISRIRKELTELKIHNCFGFEDEELDCICSLFPDLTTLYFSSVELAQKVYGKFKNIKKLERLILEKTQLSLPEDLSFFNQLKSIAISHECKINELELLRLWGSCKNVEDLCVVKLTHFDPRLYPYPEKLLNMSAHASDLSKWLEGDDLIIVRLFPNLTSLVVYGNVSGKLLAAIYKIIHTTKITVDLKEYNDSDI